MDGRGSRIGATRGASGLSHPSRHGAAAVVSTSSGLGYNGLRSNARSRLAHDRADRRGDPVQCPAATQYSCTAGRALVGRDELCCVRCRIPGALSDAGDRLRQTD